MRNIIYILATLLATTIASSTLAQNSPLGTTMLPEAIKNFELPNFDENAGIKLWELFGDQAVFVSDTQIDIDKLKLDIYEGKKTPKLKAVITSPIASTNPKTKIVISNSTIHVKGEGFELDGKKWKWNGEKKIVEIFSDVKIDMKAQSFSESADKKKQDAITKASSNYATLNHAGKNNLFKLAENVKVRSDNMSLDCQKLEIDAGKDSNGKDCAEFIRAAGDIKMLYDNKETLAQKALIIPERGLAILEGSPSVSDIPSKSILKAESIKIDRHANKIDAVKIANSKIRPSVKLTHFEKPKTQNILITADSIEMQSQTKKNVFVFKGNVNVKADDFDASSDLLYAEGAKSAKDSSKIDVIKGEGNVVLSNESGIARSREMLIIPAKSEIWLGGNASLVNDKEGTKLECAVLILMREQNKGIALADAKNNKSFVNVLISETRDIAEELSLKDKPAKIRSRRLNFSKEGNELFFTFLRDVNITSAETNATCQKMEIFADSNKKGGTKINKIIATENVILTQKEYESRSEHAVIYPRVKTQDSKKSTKQQRLAELSTPIDNPGMRPQIKLPAFKNIGMEDSELAKKAESKPTIIKSDKQWLSSSKGIEKYYFEGNVEATGTDMNSKCDRIIVIIRPPKGNAPRQISQIIMVGNVKLSQGLKDVSCGRADIHVDEEMAILSDNPVVVNREDNSRVTGQRIVYSQGKRTISVENEPTPPKPKMPSVIEQDDETPPRPSIKIKRIKTR